MSTASPRPTLITVQYLRAAAALMVLLHHARNPKPWLFDPMVGWNFTFGVEIFFVISGFIMYAAARHEAPVEFVRRRLIRVVPLYWIATLTLVVWGVFREWPAPDGGHLLASLLMVAHEDPQHPGLAWPVLIPGWTLNYEVFFYGVFAVGLALRRVTLVSAGVLLALVAAGFALSPADAVLKSYTSPILLAFLAGLGIAWLQARTVFDRAWPLAPIAGAVLLAHATPWIELPKLAVLGLSALLVAGALGLEVQARTRPSRVLGLLGDASYAIYLFHTLVLSAASWWVKGLPLSGWPQFIVAMAAGMGASVAAGVAIHLWVEKPMLKVLLRIGRPLRAPPASLPTAAEAPAPDIAKAA
ncbi:acyltransferase family protein [Phenylobacterium deserti]|nr:acyltransferase [Phenylobacterium deserti]